MATTTYWQQDNPYLKSLIDDIYVGLSTRRNMRLIDARAMNIMANANIWLVLLNRWEWLMRGPTKTIVDVKKKDSNIREEEYIRLSKG